LTGIINGVPDAKLKAAEKVLRQALKDDPLDRGIISRIYETAESKRCDKLMPVPEAMLGDLTIGLHSGYIEYHSRRHTFTDWAANDASRFRSETRRAQSIFASVILDQLFTASNINTKTN